ncbi:hypothetical protein [Corynebacterium xerosis]|uniref:hypothetical protein n=1 Tax=Corynebacterium xerosis TaxID=1725 RepID=UPI0015E0636D|nr:hypothetical protein [Corynebacterium xerosis]
MNPNTWKNRFRASHCSIAARTDICTLVSVDVIPVIDATCSNVATTTTDVVPRAGCNRPRRCDRSPDRGLPFVPGG